MAHMVINWSGDGIIRIEAALKTLFGRSRKRNALRRAVNLVGDRTHTQVVRSLGRQIRAPQRVIRQYGAVRRIKANNSSLSYVIRSDGGPIPLKYFRANQTAKGVSAAPWGNRKVYRHAFLIGKFGQHAFWRTSAKRKMSKGRYQGKMRQPIERIAGPNVPKEIVKDEVKKTFETFVSKQLPNRVEHEIKVITKGVLS